MPASTIGVPSATGPRSSPASIRSSSRRRRSRSRERRRLAVLAETFLRSGKVRDLSRLNDGRLLLLASDRVSAFGVVLPPLIPGQGRALPALSRFWCPETGAIVPNHLLDTGP